MDYFDQESQNNANEQREQRSPNQSPKQGKLGYFLTGLIGVIVGALIVAFALPQLSDTFNKSSSTDNESAISNNQTSQTNTTKTQNVSVSVNSDITKAVTKAEKAVVGVSNIQSQNFWNQGGSSSNGSSNGSSNSQSGTSEQEAGSGSGVIYKKSNGKAFIVTNNHVVEGADELEVTLSDNTKLKAKLLGSDQWTDLAVLEVDGSKIDTIANFGDSSKLKLAEPVVAIGNPLGEAFSGSVTQGVVSGINRTVPVDLNNDGQEDWQETVIQTDAAINPGNSGGALINVNGQVIGINSMKISQESVEGIGFSIPINDAEPIITNLEKYGKIKRPSMGVTLQNVADIPSYHLQETLHLPKSVTKGVMIESVVSNSAASKAGIKELDVITELDGNKIDDILSLRKYLYTKKNVGDSMKVTYYRSGKKHTTTMKLANESQL